MYILKCTPPSFTFLFTPLGPWSIYTPGGSGPGLDIQLANSAASSNNKYNHCKMFVHVSMFCHIQLIINKCLTVFIYRKTSDRSPRLLSVQIALTPACIRDPAFMRDPGGTHLLSKHVKVVYFAANAL